MVQLISSIGQIGCINLDSLGQTVGYVGRIPLIHHPSGETQFPIEPLDSKEPLEHRKMEFAPSVPTLR